MKDLMALYVGENGMNELYKAVLTSFQKQNPDFDFEECTEEEINDVIEGHYLKNYEQFTKGTK